MPGGGLDPAAYRADAFEARVTALEAALADRQAGEPERSVLLFGIGGRAADLDGDIAALEDELRRTPYALLGGPQSMADALLERNERWGLSYTVCFDADLDKMIPVVAALR